MKQVNKKNRRYIHNFGATPQKRGRVYLDHAAGTPVSADVLKKIISATKNDFGNPSGLHQESVASKKTLKESRVKTASFLSAHPDEIIFTSGGTESNNIAILGTFEFLLKETGGNLKNFHAVTSATEHSSVIEVFKGLEKKGLKVTYLQVSEDGLIDISELKKSLRGETAVVSIMYANNEIGTVQPIREIAKTIRHFRKHKIKNKKSGRKKVLNESYPIFHTDACQAALYLEMNVLRLGVDLLTLSGSKIYGPRETGVLFKRRGINLSPIFKGGNQEFGLRPGTENVLGALGVAEALEIAGKNKQKEFKRVAALRDYFLKKIIKDNPEIIINGSLSERLPNNINISFPGIDNEELVIRLDALGVACSTKSACKSDDAEVSYVIRALGENHYPESAVRFTLGRGTEKKELDYATQAIKESLKLMTKNYKL